jgi:hypothetical protein
MGSENPKDRTKEKEDKNFVLFYIFYFLNITPAKKAGVIIS